MGRCKIKKNETCFFFLHLSLSYYIIRIIRIIRANSICMLQMI